MRGDPRRHSTVSRDTGPAARTNPLPSADQLASLKVRLATNIARAKLIDEPRKRQLRRHMRGLTPNALAASDWVIPCVSRRARSHLLPCSRARRQSVSEEISISSDQCTLHPTLRLSHHGTGCRHRATAQISRFVVALRISLHGDYDHRCRRLLRARDRTPYLRLFRKNVLFAHYGDRLGECRNSLQVRGRVAAARFCQAIEHTSVFRLTDRLIAGRGVGILYRPASVVARRLS
jgi:hypothetical protein